MKMMIVFFVCALVTGAVCYFLYHLFAHIAELSWEQGRGEELPGLSKLRFCFLVSWLATLLVFAGFIAMLIQH